MVRLRMPFFFWLLNYLLKMLYAIIKTVNNSECGLSPKLTMIFPGSGGFSREQFYEQRCELELDNLIYEENGKKGVVDPRLTKRRTVNMKNKTVTTNSKASKVSHPTDFTSSCGHHDVFTTRLTEIELLIWSQRDTPSVLGSLVLSIVTNMFSSVFVKDQQA